MEFEWDENKAAANEAKHGVSFEEARQAFYDPNAVEGFDNLHSNNDLRFYLIGLSARRLLYIIFAERGGNGVIRIISARKAEKSEQKEYVESN